MTSTKMSQKKKLPKSTSEMSKELLMETLKKKKECNAKALAIVERLCESPVCDEDWFLSQLGFINQSHFDDIVVERAISKLCGYPLCSSKLENIPSKKYHISTKHNKVFDITERKNFCSSNCYKSGIYLKNQLLTSPLWFRDKEIIPKFKLFHCSESVGLGEEVVFFPEREKLKEEILSEENRKNDVSEVISDFEQLSLKNRSTENSYKDRNIIDKNSDIKLECAISCKEEEKEECFINSSKNNPVKRANKVEERFCDISDMKMNAAVDPVQKVERCVYEWFSIDTVHYLYGEEKVKEIMKEHKDDIENILKSKPLYSGHDEKFDMMLKFYSLWNDQLDDFNNINRGLKPLPDYSAVKEDGRKLELKVRAFYNGQLEVKEYDIVEKKNEEDNNEENEIYLPPVDTCAQKSLRIKILLDKFNKIIPELIRTFTTASCFEISELRNLVNRFTLSANNITFKPGEWYLIGFIVIKLLSVKNKQLECLLKCDKGKKHITLFLMNYGLPENYLENVMEWLMNPEDLIKKLN